VAFDGLDGLRQAQDFAPHVAFLDLNMPGIDGIELAQRLRSDFRTRATKLIAVTGMGQQADIARTREAGFIAHLSKPAAAGDIERLAAGDDAAVVSAMRREHGV
jgi:CheY-like chemotaxis protein